MGYDCGDSFPFNFEPNRIPFCSKSKGKLSPRSYQIQFERKWKYSFLSVARFACMRFHNLVPGCCRGAIVSISELDSRFPKRPTALIVDFRFPDYNSKCSDF